VKNFTVKNALATFLALLALSIAPIVFAEKVVVVHANNNNDLSEKDIARIFLGKDKSYSNGVRAMPVDQKNGSAIRSNFVSTVLKKTDQQVQAYWAKLRFTGKGKPPKELNGSAAVKNFVAENPGSIAYIDSKDVDGSVKVVYRF